MTECRGHFFFVCFREKDPPKEGEETRRKDTVI